MTKKEQFYIALEKFDNDTKKAAEAVNLNISSAYAYIRQRDGVEPRPKKKPSELRTIEVEALIKNERLDVKKIIMDALFKMPDNAVAYEDTFRRDLQITTDRWRDYRDEPEFDKNKAMLPSRKIVWGSIVAINRIKQMDGVK